MNTPSTILYFTTDWWGSDARALGQSLRAEGHALIECNYEDYFSLSWSSTLLRIIRRLIRPLIAADYNRHAQALLRSSKVDFILVFKGMLLSPETLQLAKELKLPVYCFYPDVSFMSHGANIPQCLPYYDHIFTTKSFHLSDSKLQKINPNWSLIQHGYDPEVHRALELSESQKQNYGCDLSFIGCWSPQKEYTLNTILTALPELDLKIWGPGWHKANTPVQKCWMKRGAYGDELALIYNASRINLSLLSEASSDTQSGDQVTARTWQIPASGGFSLHQSNRELAQYFVLGKEIAVFEDDNDVSSIIQNYLKDETTRRQISHAGKQRAIRSGYSYNQAAQIITEHYLDTSKNI